MLRHIPACVRRNGPLCMYSNYNMEDKIGNIVSQVHGTNDVIFQICDRYLLQRNVMHNIKDSSISKEYNEKIRHNQKRDKPLKISNLSDEEISLIQNAAGPNYNLFKEKYINGDFYEIYNDEQTARKTCDSFCVTKNGRLGSICSIFTNVHGLTFLLLLNKYIFLENDISHKIHFLQLNNDPSYFIVNKDEIGKKAVLMISESFMAYSSFPNHCERD